MLTRIVEGFGFNSCSQYWPSGPVGRKKKVGGNLEIQLYDDQVQFEFISKPIKVLLSE